MKICFNARRAVGLTATAIFFLALALQVVSARPIHAAFDDSTTVSTSTPEGRLAVFDDVWETIQQRYYDSAFNGVDWEGSRLTFRALAAKAKNTREFYEVIRKMLSPLRDAHTRVYSPEEKFDWWNPRFITLGFMIREVEGTPTVIQVEKTSEAARAGIRPGDVLLNIDNIPAKEFINQKLQKPGLASDASSRFRAVANALEGPAGSTVKIEWQSKAGKRRSASLTRFWNQRQLGFSSQRATTSRSSRSRRSPSLSHSNSASRFPRCWREQRALFWIYVGMVVGMPKRWLT